MRSKKQLIAEIMDIHASEQIEDFKRRLKEKVFAESCKSTKAHFSYDHIQSIIDSLK